jgi:hypothetical protein
VCLCLIQHGAMKETLNVQFRYLVRCNYRVGPTVALHSVAKRNLPISEPGFKVRNNSTVRAILAPVIMDLRSDEAHTITQTVIIMFLSKGMNKMNFILQTYNKWGHTVP